MIVFQEILYQSSFRENDEKTVTKIGLALDANNEIFQCVYQQRPTFWKILSSGQENRGISYALCVEM
jgi:hypothetical protein